MNITIVQGGALPIPPIRGGAIEKVWYNLGREFAKRGHTVTHVSRAYEGLPGEEWLEGVRHARVPGFEFSNNRRLVVWRDLQYSLRVLCRLPRADIVVTNSPTLPLLIRTPHFGALYVHMGRFPKGQTMFYRHAARLQTVSRAVARAIAMQDPKSASKVRVIPYPLPASVPKVDVTATWPARRKEILYVGRIHPEKGVHELVEGFRRIVQAGLKDWILTVVGPWASAQGGGGEEYYELLRRRIAPISSRATLVGPVFDHDVLRTYYRRARLFAYPSLAERGESFGLAPLEAMAEGCPPLVSALECFREYLEDGRSGFVFDHRSGSPAEKICSALNRIATSEEELMSVAARGYEAAKAFDPSVIAERYLEDFSAVARAGSILPGGAAH